jgi:hypothetical protein
MIRRFGTVRLLIEKKKNAPSLGIGGVPVNVGYFPNTTFPSPPFGSPVSPSNSSNLLVEGLAGPSIHLY